MRNLLPEVQGNVELYIAELLRPNQVMQAAP
jgi:hypothetical protein